MEGYEGVDALKRLRSGGAVWCRDEGIFFIILTPNYGLFRGQNAGRGGGSRACNV